MISLENVTKLYNNYNYPMNLEQKKLIIALYYHFDPSNNIKNLNKYIQTALSDKTKTINNLSFKDIHIIDILKNESKINEYQIKYLSEKLSISQLESFVGKKFISDITIAEFDNITKSPTISPYRYYNDIVLTKTCIVTGYSPDYETGYVYQNKNKESLFEYIKFYDLLLFDYDISLGETKETLLNKIKNVLPETLSFKIYETYNGYHVFLMSYPIHHSSEDIIHLSKKFLSDNWYTLYSRFHGYSIRISPKSGRNEIEEVNKYICDIGSGNMHKKCLDMIEIFEQFKNKSAYRTYNNDDISKIVHKNAINLTASTDKLEYFGYFLKQTNVYNYSNIVEPNKVKYSRDFKKYLIDLYGKSYETIVVVSKLFKSNIMKPHKYIYSDAEYFIALDIFVNMYCIYYFDLLVIDIDFDEVISNLDDVIQLVNTKHNETGDSYIVYSTNKGVHIFVSNRHFQHQSKETIDYMLNFNADVNHTLMTYCIGWCIRLNKKTPDDKMYKHVYSIGENHSRKHLVDLHIEYSDKYSNTTIKKINHF